MTWSTQPLTLAECAELVREAQAPVLVGDVEVPRFDTVVCSADLYSDLRRTAEPQATDDQSIGRQLAALPVKCDNKLPAQTVALQWRGALVAFWHGGAWYVVERMPS